MQSSTKPCTQTTPPPTQHHNHTRPGWHPSASNVIVARRHLCNHEQRRNATAPHSPTRGQHGQGGSQSVRPGANIHSRRGRGFQGHQRGHDESRGKRVLRLPPTTLEVHDAQGHIPTTPTTMRGESTTGQRRRQSKDHSESRRWTWDAKQERPRPPTTCVHTGPTQRLRDGFWPGQAHVYLFTAPADDAAAPTDAELRELKERIHATGGPGTLNSSVSYDWVPNSKHQRSTHAIPTSSDSGDKHTTMRAWQQRWTGTPDGAGQGHQHTVPPGHVPTSLHAWLHEMGVHSAERQAVKEKLGEASAGECATLEQEHARHAYTASRRCGTDPNQDTGKDMMHQCPGARQGCAQWTTHLWKPNNATHEGVCYSCALHACLRGRNRANRPNNANTNTPTHRRRQTATTSIEAGHHTTPATPPPLTRGGSAGSTTSNHSNSSAGTTQTAIGQMTITRAMVQRLARADVHNTLTRGESKVLRHAAATETPECKKRPRQPARSNSHTPAAQRQRTTTRVQHSIVVDQARQHGKLHFGAKITRDHNMPMTVQGADAKSPAERAGLQAGDHIISIKSETPPMQEAHVRTWLQDKLRDRRVKLVITRTQPREPAKRNKRPTHSNADNPANSPAHKSRRGSADRQLQRTPATTTNITTGAAANRMRTTNSSARMSTTEEQTCPHYVLGIENADQQDRQTAAETQGNATHALLLQDKSKGKTQGQQRMKDQQMVRRAQKQMRTGQHRTCAKCKR